MCINKAFILRFQSAINQFSFLSSTFSVSSVSNFARSSSCKVTHDDGNQPLINKLSLKPLLLILHLSP